MNSTYKENRTKQTKNLKEKSYYYTIHKNTLRGMQKFKC